MKIKLRVRQKREQRAVTGLNERARRLGGAFVQSAPNGAGSGPPRESAMRLQLAALECRRRSSWQVEPSRSGRKAAASRLLLPRCLRCGRPARRCLTRQLLVSSHPSCSTWLVIAIKIIAPAAERMATSLSSQN
ncbi:hypothetical protein MTO96_049018 [Rhipicephalus appendiculatus]